MGKILKGGSIMPAKTKQKLADIAYEMFKEKDESEIGVREICAKAGVTTGSFYHHFSDKYDVLAAKLDEHESYFTDFPDKEFEGSTLDKILFFLSDHMADIVLEDGLRITKIIYMTNSLSKRSSAGFTGTLSSLLESAYEAGEIKEGTDLEHYCNLLLMAFRGTVYAWCRTDGEFDLKETLREVIGIYLSNIKA